MNPLLSWAIFIAVVGGFYYISQRKNTTLKKIVDSKAVQHSKSVFLGASSGAETGDPKKKQPKKKRKAALSNTTQKELVSTDEAASDDDVAQEVDSADVAKRLQAMKDGSDGKLTPSANPRTNRQLAAPHSPFATASQTSSTGADADIDEEEGTQLPESDYPSLPKSSSTDPSDMLEESTAKPGVLRVIPSTQPPRLQKRKKSSNAVEVGVHANKNQKKKEKKKAEKDASRAEQTAAFEKHRQEQRAAEAARARAKPTQAAPPPPSRWTSTNGPSTAPVAAQPPVILASPPATNSSMLDTFVPGSQSSSHDSDEEKRNLKSTTLGDSMWEAVPSYISGPEPEWNEVKGRKGRKDRKPASQSGDEVVRKPAGRSSATGGNNFNVLEQRDESVTGSDAKTTDSEQWAEMDWAVDHSSS